MEIKLKALELPDLEKYSFPLYNRVRACLEDFYLNNSSYGYSNSDLIELIQELYFRSTYEALLNVTDSVNNSLNLDDMSVVTNTLYSIKGTKEAIEYIYSTVLGSDTDVVYDPTTRELSITHISLDILDLENTYFNTRITYKSLDRLG